MLFGAPGPVMRVTNRSLLTTRCATQFSLASGDGSGSSARVLLITWSCRCSGSPDQFAVPAMAPPRGTARSHPEYTPERRKDAGTLGQGEGEGGGSHQSQRWWDHQGQLLGDASGAPKSSGGSSVDTSAATPRPTREAAEVGGRSQSAKEPLVFRNESALWKIVVAAQRAAAALSPRELTVARVDRLSRPHFLSHKAGSGTR